MLFLHFATVILFIILKHTILYCLKVIESINPLSKDKLKFTFRPRSAVKIEHADRFGVLRVRFPLNAVFRGVE